MARDGATDLDEGLHRVRALRAAGRRAEAIEAMELVVSECSRRFGSDDTKVLSLRCSLAALWSEDAPAPSRLGETRELMSRCERALGLDHPIAIGASEQVACLLSLNGRHDEALTLTARVVASASRSFGPDDPRTLRARQTRCTALIRAGRGRDATDELGELLSDMERRGCASATLLSARRLLALSYRAAGRRAEARNVLEPLFSDCRRLYGADAPLTREVAALLAEVSTYEGPFVADAGTVPRPWVFVADGIRPVRERFGAPQPRPPAPASPLPDPPSGVGMADDAADAPAAADGGQRSPLLAGGAGVVGDVTAASRDSGTGPSSKVVVRAIGPVEIAGWTRPAERESQLAEILCYLVFHRDRPVRPAALRLALRPDLGEEISEETLRAYLSHLRRAVGRDILPHASKDGYRVSRAVSSDWQQFCCLAGGDADAAQLAAALNLVRGRPFAGVPEGFFKWVDAELVISAMETAIADAARRLAGTVAAADPERAEWAVRQGLLAAPYDWALWRLRLELAARRGPVALARARKEAEAVLGDDAASLAE